MFAVVVALVLGLVVEFLKRVEEAGGEGVVRRVREEVEVIRGFWSRGSESEKGREVVGNGEKRD